MTEELGKSANRLWGGVDSQGTGTRECHSDTEVAEAAGELLYSEAAAVPGLASSTGRALTDGSLESESGSIGRFVSLPRL